MILSLQRMVVFTIKSTFYPVFEAVGNKVLQWEPPEISTLRGDAFCVRSIYITFLPKNGYVNASANPRKYA